MLADYTPRLRHAAFAIWARNMLVWSKMIGSSVVINLGEPLLYLVAFGYGLGMFIGGQMDMPYLTFLASGTLAASAMNTAGFEALFGVFTRMVPQKSYDAMLASPLEIPDIVAGEILWCATKSLIHGTEKSVAEHGKLVDPTTVEVIELSIKKLKEAMDKDDVEKIRARSQDLTEAAMKLGEAIYKAQATQEAGQEPDGAAPGQDDVVDADFEDLDNKKN